MSADRWLEPELEDLLKAERSAHVPAEPLERVWGRIARALAPSGSEGGKPNGAGSPGWFRSHAGLFVALAFAAGGGAGAGLHAILTRRAPDVRSMPSTTPAGATVLPSHAAPEAPAVAPDSIPSAPAASSVVHSLGAARPVLRPAVTPGTASSLPVERALLDAARTALEQGDATRALALTEDHASRFPHGQLGEEREALAIQALVLEGRYDLARSRAERLRAASPNSLFLPAVDATLSSIP